MNRIKTLSGFDMYMMFYRDVLIQENLFNRHLEGAKHSTNLEDGSADVTLIYYIEDIMEKY